MYSDVQTFMTEIGKAQAIPNRRNAAKVIYGKVAAILPTREKVREFAEATFRADKARREKRFAKLKELKAPACVMENEEKMLAKVADFETWLSQSRIGKAFVKIWGPKGYV